MVVEDEWAWWKTDEVLAAPSSTLIKMFPWGLRAMAAIFLRFWNAKVKDLLLYKGFVSCLRAQLRSETVTDFTKSKTETLLPTGLSTEFPSGVNIMFPC
jgi:hypothetical protein